MPTVYKVLGQVATAATTDTTLYTAPSSTSVVVSTINVCNRGGATTFRIAVRPAGATIANQHYLAFDTTLPANDALAVTIGVSLAATDVITVRATSANVTFAAFGAEIT
jgi:hypothetical protein